MSKLLVMEAANLFCGDHDPTDSKHLILSELGLPALTETTQTHGPSGGPFSIDIPTGFEKLEAGFKFTGWDPDTMVQFGLGGTVTHAYTAYGVVRDRQTGEGIRSKAIMRGRLSKVEADAFKRGELQGYDYSIGSMDHYELWLGDREIYFFDFFASIWRVDGVPANDHASILQIPG